MKETIFFQKRIYSELNHVLTENCVLLGYYAASSGNSLPTFRDNISVPSSRVNNPWMGPIVCLKTSARNYHYSLRNSPGECSSHLHRGGSLESHKHLLLVLLVTEVYKKKKIPESRHWSRLSICIHNWDHRTKNYFRVSKL
jgi:hypothetical protein